jgi:hypothetical protein
VHKRKETKLKRKKNKGFFPREHYTNSAYKAYGVINIDT